MRRHRLLAAAIGVLALGLTPVMAGAAPLTSADYGKPVAFYRFCAEAQLDVANMDADAMAAPGVGITIGGTIYDDFDAFVLAKSAVSISDRKVLVAQYIDYTDEERTMPKTHRCKLRTGESLAEGAWPAGSANNSGRFAVDPHYGFGSLAEGISTAAVDLPCSVVNQQTVTNTWDGLSAEQQQDAAEFDPDGATPRLVVGDDAMVGTGAEWTQPFEPVTDDDGTLKVVSRPMVVPSDTPEGPPRFRAAHYCSLVAPEYVRAIMLGDVEVV